MVEIKTDIKKDANEDTPDKVKSEKPLIYAFIGYFVIRLLMKFLIQIGFF